jgi:hypothetical protein
MEAASPFQKTMGHQQQRRPLRRREFLNKTRSFDEGYAFPASAASPSGSSCSTTISVSSNEDSVPFNGDVMTTSSPTHDMKVTSVRKRPSPRSPMDDAAVFGDSPMRFSPSQNTARRKKKKKNTLERRKGFLYLLKRKQWAHAVLIVMSLLFICSFFFSFLGFQSIIPQPTTTRSPHSWRKWSRSKPSIPIPQASRQTTSWTHVLSFHLRQPDRRTNPATPALRGTTPATNAHQPFQQYSIHAPQCSAPSDMTPDDVDFTLATQMSLNRLWMMEHHCARWTQAISLAVYVGNDTTATVNFITDELLQMGCAPERQPLHIQTLSGYSEEEYPVNTLRNIALAAVTTSHVVYVDVDFWESIDLYDTLLHHRAVLASNSKLALVVPAFQLSRQCREWRDCRDKNIPKMPHVKDELVDLMVDHQANAFDPSNRGGHGSTRYKDWLIQQKDELVSIECIKSNRYEPYLVFRKCHHLPPFQEAFTGYGKNKMTWMMQLRRTGYHFMQLGGAFVVHYPHLDSTARMHWNGGKDGSQLPKPRDPSIDLSTFKRGQIDATFVAFREWLSQAIPDQAVVPMCEDALDDDERLWIAPPERKRRRR